MNNVQTSMGCLLELDHFASVWNLNNVDKQLLNAHFLRNWSAGELAEQVSFVETLVPVVKLWGDTYIIKSAGDIPALDQVLYAAVREKPIPLDAKPCKFWLSFRKGITSDDVPFAFVIVQEDIKGSK